MKMSSKLNATENNIAQLEYDDFGNVTKSISNGGFETQIEYDELMKLYPTKISNSYGDESTIDMYSYLFNMPLKTTDVNGQVMKTRIDDKGRVVHIVAPNEIDYMGPNNDNLSLNYTIHYQYEGENDLIFALSSTSGNLNDDTTLDHYIVNSGTGSSSNSPSSVPAIVSSAKHHAVTRHNIHQNNQDGDYLLTVSLIDGFGKAIQLKKTNFSGGQLNWLISGKEKKDPYGRTLESYLPTNGFNYPNSAFTLPNDIFDYDDSTPVITEQSFPTITTYDVKDRPLTIQQPEEANVTTMSYGIDGNAFTTLVTNEENQTLETYTDVKGRQLKTMQNGELETKFYYNVIGEKIKVKNQQQYETKYAYDLAGRRLKEEHPDRGITTFKYDTNNNLIERATSNLINSGSGGGGLK